MLKYFQFLLILAVQIPNISLADQNIPRYFNTKAPEIMQMLKDYGVKNTINHSLKKDCGEGNELSCAVLKYRLEKTEKNITGVIKVLNQYPCRISQIENCTHHLFARIYMEKHRQAKRLAKKLCQLNHQASCRQLLHYQSLKR